MKDKGLVILGFPCNQFGGQESKSESEVKSFCESKYKGDFCGVIVVGQLTDFLACSSLPDDVQGKREISIMARS